MKKNNISLLDVEASIDKSIAVVINWLQLIWSKGKYVILAIIIIVLYIKWDSIVVKRIINPINDTIKEGITASQMAISTSIGIVAGLGAPGLTLQIMLILFFITSKFGFNIGVAEIAVATSINFALSFVDLLTWKAFFMRIGASIIPSGGLYLRPFFAGMIPYTVLAIPALTIIYQLLKHLLIILGMAV